MKKLLLSSVLLLFIFSTVWAEYVVLKDGRSLEGKLLGKKGNTVYLEKADEILAIDRSLINNIKNDGNQPIMRIFWGREEDLQKDFPSAKEVKFSSDTASSKTRFKNNRAPFQQTEYKVRWVNFGVSLLSGFLAWDYFAEASDIQQNIDSIKKHDLDDNNYYSELKDDLKVTRTRKEVCGSVFAVVSFICFATSLEKIEIEASPTSLSLSYKF
jgi:hypothetical protein